MKKIFDPEFGEIPLGKPANVINNTSDVVKVLGKDFSGTSWQFVDSIAKNTPSKDYKEAINIFNHLKESLEKEGIIWRFKKEEK